MKPVLLTMAVLLLLCQVIPGGTEKCWGQRGSCRETCRVAERAYIFCRNGNLCCVPPKGLPNLTPR
ncbi:beta-defensin 122-like [Otolemur garnettii]|uniref:beta-defensin 122-like n=1 Tax=Otolemur garnettii TaxID=30611 RepID=UPI000C7EC067|nr:beta-defensin 122-like [Otolemur garnettii]